MKSTRTSLKVTLLVLLVTLVSAGALWDTQRVQAQAQEVPPPTGERISFGMVGITTGQTIRIDVVNTHFTREGELPPDPCRVVLTFLDAEGRHFRNRDGSIVRRAVQLQPARATSLELNADEFATDGGRIQLRPLVTVVPPPDPGSNALPPDPCVPSVEVFSNHSRETSYVMWAWRMSGFNHNETLVRDVR